MRAAVVTWWFLLLVPMVMATGTAVPESFELRRVKAFKLADQHAPGAEAALLALLKEKPADADVLLQLGLLTADEGHRLKVGSPARRKVMQRAHAYFLAAQKAGSAEPILATALSELDADGTEHVKTFSTDSAAQKEIASAEQAFAARDIAGAQRHYEAALKLEPNNYAATLYLGDTYFVTDNLPRALELFERATKLDPDRDPAYRYAGDALMRLGRKDDALEQYLSAVIAQPYIGYSWKALQAGSNAFLLKPWPMAASLPQVKVTPKGTAQQIELPEAPDLLQVAYGTARAKWQSEHNAQRFPSPAVYRQTLEEEFAALEALLAVGRELEAAAPTAPAIARALAPYAKSLHELAEVQTA